MTGFRKIVVVDDDEFFMTELAEFFRRQGCGVATGRNGLDAIRLVRDEQPDLLLMDIHMPEMGGLEAAGALKQAGALRTRVVLMSGDRDGVAEARGLAGVAVVEKPLDLKALRELIRG